MNNRKNLILITKNLCLLIVAFLFFKEANTQTISPPKGSFSISGNAAGIDNDVMILEYQAGQNFIKDSAKIETGHFYFKGSLQSPTPARVYIKGSKHQYADQNINFYLENSPIIIWVDKDSMNFSKVSGSSSNNDKDSIEALMVPYYESLRALHKVQDFASKQHLPSVLKSLDKIYDELPDAQRKLIVDYAFSHPDSYAITQGLSINFTNNQTELPLLKKIYDNFSAEVKKSPGGNDIAALIKRIERVQLGNKAPDFILPNQNGKQIEFSSFKRKYVLLDFWASWCVPCRAESPFLVKAFHDYKNKNFTIISVSMDEAKDKQKWLDAIKKDNMQWTQLSSLKGYEENGVRQLYSVQGIPDNFLIDPSGKIIARGLRGEELEKKLAVVIK